jgi:hypothetical protein
LIWFLTPGFVASKGIGANFLKIGSKRRRIQPEISNEKADQALAEIRNDAYVREVSQL